MPTGSQLYRRWVLLSLLVSVISVVVIAAYLVALLRLPPDQLRGFALGVLPVGFVFMWAVSNATSVRLFRPLRRRLDELAAGTLDDEGAREGFREACNMPVLQFAVGAGWWLVGGLLVASAMKIGFPTFAWFSWSIMVVAAFTGGLLSMIFNFYRLKALLEPVREGFGTAVGDPATRGALVRRVPLAQKLTVSMAGVLVVTLGFAALLAQVRATHSVEGLANRLQRQALEEAAASWDGDGDGDAGGALPVVDGELSALGTRFVLLDEEAREVVRGADLLLAGERQALRSLGVEAGDSVAFDSPNAFVWRRVPGGVLVAVADPEVLAAESAGIWIELGLFAAVAVAFAVWMARLAARDVARVSEPLLVEVQRVASGDLTRGRIIDSEDELGDLARGFQVMADALHDTVGRMVAAARGVDETARGLSAVGEDLASVTADQVQGLSQVTDSMGRIKAEVGGIAESAHALSMSVEESSSSVLELGVTGEQLSQNASTLNERVAEVSSSIEQMMQSARQVAASIEALAGASTETSSSMEEMAASLREVDSNATQTARLSEDVVGIADRGRQKVEQTIRGMHAIQEATDVAQHVIHGLGARTEEIGKILNVIDDVADETNLLALNAAIIAAQAGEHGRAFSVVADEIKDLADKVIASTKEIGGLIRSVQEETGNAVGAIETGARSVESGVELSAEAGVALEEITTASRQSGERIGEIVAAVREQSKAAAHVVSLMDQVRNGAEQIRSAGSEQTHGNEVVLRSTVTMRDVSQQVSGATDEQARGAHRMREAIESVRSAVEQINESLQQQSSACEQIAGLLERVSARTVDNESSAGRMRDATRGLQEQAESLRESVRHFRV